MLGIHDRPIRLKSASLHQYPADSVDSFGSEFGTYGWNRLMESGSTMKVAPNPKQVRPWTQYFTLTFSQAVCKNLISIAELYYL